MRNCGGEAHWLGRKSVSRDERRPLIEKAEGLWLTVSRSKMKL